jgi:hypothetical protein
MDGCSVDVVSGTACTLRIVQDLDVGAAVRAHSLGVMARQEELVAWRGLQDRHLSHRGRRSVEERRARDSLADCQSHGMYLANLIVRLWLRTGRSSTPARSASTSPGSPGKRRRRVAASIICEPHRQRRPHRHIVRRESGSDVHPEPRNLAARARRHMSISPTHAPHGQELPRFLTMRCVGCEEAPCACLRRLDGGRGAAKSGVTPAGTSARVEGAAEVRQGARLLLPMRTSR